MKVKKILAALLFSGLVTLASAQIKTPSPSPIQTIKQEVGLAEMEITYSRPSLKGRMIFGDLVPFDKLWRTGANASTKLKFSDALTVNGIKVEKGEYALYTIPGTKEWTIILYKDVSCWGVCDEYSQEKEAARFVVTPVSLAGTVETFTISLDNVVNNGATLTLSWEKTAVSFKLENDVDTKVMAAIDAFMNPKPTYSPYYNAASYYLEANKDLNKALEYVNKALSLRSTYWILHLKAKIQYGLKDYKGALDTAELSKKTAVEEKSDDYVLLNDKLIAKIKAGK